MTGSLPPLIPREILFGNPERTQPRISPDGGSLSFIAPDDRNILQVWLRPLAGGDPKRMTADKKRGIRRHFWSEDGRFLLYVQDADGDENWHLYGIEVSTGIVRDFTPFQTVQARIFATHHDHPDEILVGLNVRNAELHDAYRLTLSTGALVLETENPGDVLGFVADADFRIRACAASRPDGSTILRVRDTPASPWTTWLEADPSEALDIVTFTADGKSLVLVSSLGRNTSAVVERKIADHTERVIASQDDVDAGSILVHPRTYAVEAVSFAPDRERWTVVAPAVRADFEALAKVDAGDFAVGSRDLRDELWVVPFSKDRGPVAYHLWDRRTRKATFLFTHQPRLEGLTLAEMRPIRITARDGLSLPAYLSLPVGVDQKNLPMVLLPHGGPWARDHWGYSPTAQWMANRGWACLQLNFRGSTGFGKNHLNAGNREWGKKMHDDLIDACAWAVAEGIADPARIAIYGGSYGGYSVLAGLAFTPEQFVCGVDLVGPSNLFTLIRSIPPYWKVMRGHFDFRVGNIDDPADEALLREASPLFAADRIVRPLLIGQGANDPRVPCAEPEQIRDAIVARGGRVTYVLYPDEGHGFARPENRMDFHARAEAFLAEHLGGRFEPMDGDRVHGASAVVDHGRPVRGEA